MTNRPENEYNSHIQKIIEKSSINYAFMIIYIKGDDPMLYHAPSADIRNSFHLVPAFASVRYLTLVHAIKADKAKGKDAAAQRETFGDSPRAASKMRFLISTV